MGTEARMQDTTWTTNKAARGGAIYISHEADCPALLTLKKVGVCCQLLMGWLANRDTNTHRHVHVCVSGCWHMCTLNSVVVPLVIYHSSSFPIPPSSSLFHPQSLFERNEGQYGGAIFAGAATDVASQVSSKIVIEEPATLPTVSPFVSQSVTRSVELTGNKAEHQGGALHIGWRRRRLCNRR